MDDVRPGGDALPTRRSLREAERRREAERAEQSFPSRRERREAETRAATEAGLAASVSAPANAPQRRVDSAPRPAASTRAAPVPVAVPVAPTAAAFAAATSRRPVTAASVRRVRPLAAPAYADAPAAPAARTRRPRRRFSGLLTMIAVGGLFASAALPAYALSTGSADAATSGTASVDASSASLNLAGHGAPIVDREAFDATSEGDLAAQRANAVMQQNYDAYMLSGAAELGDDYPWFSSPSYNQGGGLSPLNYYYRECVDFVAWRLNRDAGVAQAPWKYTWSDLTPGGGNASQWLGAWRAHGWTVSTTPKVGSVAWFPYNHVAYVSKVNPDGTVLLEEYNYQNDHLYGQRTVAATDVAEYLYAPPR